MASRTRAKGILIYNLLLKEVTKINKNLPEDRKLSIKERRQLISNRIYPKYKDQGRTRIRLKPLREGLFKTIKRLPRKEGCDVFAIPPEVYQDILYYEIEQFIESILPNCIYIKVDAGQFGETSIFNTRDFNYYTSGISDITNRINDYARSKNIDTYNQHFYVGRINLRPRKPNNGNPENYFLEMILSGTGKREKPITNIPHKKKTKSQIKREGNIKQYIKERLTTLKSEKSVFKKIKKKIINSISTYKTITSTRYLTASEKERVRKKTYTAIAKKIKSYYDSGTITEAKYRKFTSQINKGLSKGKGKGSKK